MVNKDYKANLQIVFLVATEKITKGTFETTKYLLSRRSTHTTTFDHKQHRAPMISGTPIQITHSSNFKKTLIDT